MEAYAAEMQARDDEAIEQARLAEQQYDFELMEHARVAAEGLANLQLLRNQATEEIQV